MQLIPEVLPVLLVVLWGTPAHKPEIQVVAGEIEVSRSKAVFEKGPQHFIASLQVEPALDEGRFVGFRLLAFLPGSPMVNNASIQPGDIIVSVNEEPLERPEQFMRAWDIAKSAQTIEIGLMRGTTRYLYRFKLVGSVP